MSAMPAGEEQERTVQLLIPAVPESMRRRIKIAAARMDINMQEFELRAMQIGLDVLDPEGRE